MDKIRFAIIGYGHIGKRHAAMIEQNPDCLLTAVIDVNEEEKYGVPQTVAFHKSFDSFITSGTTADIVTIATPNGLHAIQAKQALLAGHHVVIEKPMGLHTTECKDLITVASEVGRYLFCVMQNRYSPPSEWLKQLVTNEILGDIYIVQVNCYWNRDERYYKPGSWHGTKHLDGGTLFTQFSHFIDLLYWVFGDIDDINANFSSFNHKGLTDFEDSGVVDRKSVV